MTQPRNLDDLLPLLNDDSPKVRQKMWDVLASHLPAWEGALREAAPGLPASGEPVDICLRHPPLPTCASTTPSRGSAPNARRALRRGRTGRSHSYGLEAFPLVERHELRIEHGSIQWKE